MMYLSNSFRHALARTSVECVTAWCLVLALLVGAIFVPQSTAMAQRTDGLTLSVSPVLIETSAEPAQRWQSSLKVTNVNDFDLTVFPRVVNFQPHGERGLGRFRSVAETGGQGETLAEWIDVRDTAVTIPRGGSVELPYTVTVPPGAAPGGHYAAILVSTEPPAETGGMRVQTTQAVSSLFFIRVAGDIIEDGRVREFRTTERLLSSPAADFVLRFENTGNVHLRPQGQITITNMWGQERGVIPVNQQSRFGNVLPDNIRRYTFSWQGDWSIADLGRYRAAATLAYGESARQFSSRETHFWVIPVIPLLSVLGGLALLVWLIMTAIRAYIRRMLVLAGVDPTAPRPRERVTGARHDLRIERYAGVGAPVSAGVQDLRVRMSTATPGTAKLHALWEFFVAYRAFFAFTLMFAIAAWVILWFISSASAPNRPYEVTIADPDTNVRLSSEDIIYRKRYGAASQSEVSTSTPPVAVVNRSGTAGAGADARYALEQAGYRIETLTATTRTERATVIVHTPATAATALALADVLGDALLSATPGGAAGYAEPVVVFLGSDREAE